MTNAEAIALGAFCNLCPLKGNPIVPPTPAKSGRVNLVIVGEGPGRVEENLGAPFVGQSGKLLDVELKRAGLRRSECHVTNTALCKGDTDKENEEAAKCCTPRLLRELQSLPPSAPILLLGKAASIAVLNVRSILSGRGFIWTAKEVDEKKVKEAYRKAARLSGKPSEAEAVVKADTIAGRRVLAGRTVLPTLHPSFILRADPWLPVFRIDMARAGRVVRGEVAHLEDDGNHLVGNMSVLDGLGPEVTCDIESTGIDAMTCDILCIGFAEIGGQRRTRVVWPWRDEWAPRMSKWFASRKRIVGHNFIQYDALVMRNHGIIW